MPCDVHYLLLIRLLPSLIFSSPAIYLPGIMEREPSADSSYHHPHQGGRRGHHRQWRPNNARGRGRNPRHWPKQNQETHFTREATANTAASVGPTCNSALLIDNQDKHPGQESSVSASNCENQSELPVDQQLPLSERGRPVPGRARGRHFNLRSQRGRGGHARHSDQSRDQPQNIDQLGQAQDDRHEHQAQRRPRGRERNLKYHNEIVLSARKDSYTPPVDNGNMVNSSSKEASNVQSDIAELQLRGNSFECMICCDNIHRANSIWYCTNCYNIFHLKCATEWCNKSIKSRNEAIANAQYPSLGQASTSRFEHQEVRPQIDGYSNYQTDRLNSIEWPCPACREVLYSKPDKYKCFCGKVIRPEVSRHLTPHSCGQLCGRKRPNFDCPHACNSICHPGRCSACPLTSKRACFCGKVMQEVKCSASTFSCEQLCGKVLPCGSHNCEKLCHEGSCGTCDKYEAIKCHCGMEGVQKRCIDLSKRHKLAPKNFSCNRVCGKPLDCGKHFCTEKCHPGPNCASCKLLSLNIRSCPCGSTLTKKALLSERKSCTDPVPTCGNKCNRPLICGPEKNHHKCQKKCHTGVCPPCKLKTTAHCECKLSTRTIECSLMYEKIQDGDRIFFEQRNYSFSCETRCNKLKNCGRHRCYVKCCKPSDSFVHMCNQVCTKKLVCGQHNCPETCHPGQCGDCTNIGWEELTCHCGASVLYPPIPCGALPPACHGICRRPQNCGHPVKHECHDDTKKCAPCTVFVKKSCFCGSDSKDSVYCYLSGYSCGRTCKKQLKCKQHYCKRVCHDNECETPNERGVILCTQPCPVVRYSCKHPCGLPCHRTVACQISDCRKVIEITCECGNKVERIECYKVMKDVDNRNKVAMLSTTRANQETIIVDLTRKTPPRSGTENSIPYKKLDCDETCSILKRNKALAEALEISQPDLKPVSIFGEDPLRLLKEATTQDYKFVSATYNTLVRFIKSAREADKRFIFMPFPPAGKLRREVVHELAHHFNCTSESRDEEPFRHVVVRAYKNKSCVPDFNIEQLLPVSD